MGFGLLFIGYSFAYLMSFNAYGYVFRIIGCAVMLSALSRLSAFEKRFKETNIVCAVLCAIASAESILSVALELGISLPWQGSTVENTAFIIFIVASVVYHVFLYRAVYKIASDVGIKDIKERSLRYAIFAAIEIPLAILYEVFRRSGLEVARYLLLSVFLLYYLVVALNLSLFYSCYKNICEEGDEEAPRKKSRIPFLNTLFEVSDKREKEIFEKTKSYAENRIRTENEAKKHKKKGKKRK